MHKVFQFKIQDIFCAYISVINEQDSDFWSIHSLHFGSVPIMQMDMVLSVMCTSDSKYMYLSFLKILIL